MITFKKILVPVDFSEPSKKAVTYGLTLASRFDAVLIIAHIVPESSALSYAFPTETSRVEREQEEEARHAIENLLPPAYADKFYVQKVVKTGTIERELLGIVTNEAVDLIVMGSHGRRSVARWFLGSVTERMLREFPVPVLTVSHVNTEKHEIGSISLKRVLYATDLDEASSTGLKYAVEFARGTGAQLTVLHVVDDLDRMLWGPSLIARLENERTKLVQEMKKRLDDLVAQERSSRGGEIEALVAEGKPFEKIIEFAQQRGTDLIILNLQSKSMLERAFLGSTAERVIRLARIPVLSIPIGRAPAPDTAKLS